MTARTLPLALLLLVPACGPDPAPPMPSAADTTAATLRLEVEAPAGPVRRGAPYPVAVRLVNAGAAPLVVNTRLAVGYRDSDARELFAEVLDGDAVVSRRTRLYERDPAAADDYAPLAPGEAVETTFDLLAWYDLPGPGRYALVVYYQADEPHGPAPPGVAAGTVASARVPLTVE